MQYVVAFDLMFSMMTRIAFQALAIFPLLCCLFALGGCVPQGAAPAAPEPSPFSDGSHLNPYYPQVNPYCPNCPDGICPQPYEASTLGKEVGLSAGALVNTIATTESKGQAPAPAQAEPATASKGRVPAFPQARPATETKLPTPPPAPPATESKEQAPAAVQAKPAAKAATTTAVETKGQCPTCPQARPAVVNPAPQFAPQYQHPAQYQYRPQYCNQPQYRHAPHCRYAQQYRPAPQQTWSPVPLAPGEVFLGFGPVQPASKPHAGNLMPKPDPVPNARPQQICPTGQCPGVEQRREGAFECQRCKRATVGEQWHELWANDNTPLTCLCENCWRSITPAERATELTRYARGQLKGDLSPIVQDAISEAAVK